MYSSPYIMECYVHYVHLIHRFMFGWFNEMSFQFHLYRWRKMCNAKENNGYMTQKVTFFVLLPFFLFFDRFVNCFRHSNYMWMNLNIYEFSGDLCQPLNCKKRELCLLEDAFTALCVSKTALHKNRFVSCWEQNKQTNKQHARQCINQNKRGILLKWFLCVSMFHYVSVFFGF